MVSYRDSEGNRSYHETDELNAAVAFVEHLRNDEAVSDARIFKMDELSFEFRPYFRVEIAGAMPPPPPADVLPPPPVDALPPPPVDALTSTTDVAVDEPDPLAAAWAASEGPEDRIDESVGAGMGRRGLFGR